MPLMRSPDGEVAEVPVEEVRHYMSAGATIVDNPLPGNRRTSPEGQPMRMQFPGQDEAGLEEPLLSPLDVASAGPGALMKGPGRAALGLVRGGAEAAGGAVSGAGRAIGSAAGRVASTPQGQAAAKFGLRRIPFVDLLMDSADLVKGVAARKAAQAAPEIAQEVGSAVSRTAGEVPGGVLKKAVDYYRRKGFAMLKEAGLPDDAASMSKILGKEVKSRSSLSIEDWAKIEEHATEMVARKFAAEAAKKAVARATAKAAKALPKPKVAKVVKMPPRGSAESRVAKAPKKAVRSKAAGQRTTAEAPGSLEAQLGRSNQIQAEMDRLGLTPEQQMQAWQELRRAQQ